MDPPDPIPLSTVDPNPPPETDATSQTDNFYSPENFGFYARQPYDHLDRSSRTIRLLAVTKGESGSLRCKLTDGIPLASVDGIYTAISYCAGDPKKTRTIWVNDKPFNAFANLAHAIEETYRYRSAEHGDVEALLWADQICINQSDKAERSHQVGFMYDVYSSAREVAVCLSNEEKRGSNAIPWIHHIYRHLRALEFNVPIGIWAMLYSPKFRDDGRIEASWHDLINDFESGLLDSTFKSGWIDAIQMIKQPWWSRAWVFQEYVAAKEATFLYGGQCISSLILSPVLRFLIEHLDGLNRKIACSNHEEHSLVTTSNSQQDSARQCVGFVLDPNQDFDLISLLTHSRNCGASDKRDHLYAFLGLAKDTLGINVDYSPQNDVVAVFTEFARRMIEKTDRLDIVSLVDDRNNEQLDFPSWVPDWSCDGQRLRDPYLGGTAGSMELGFSLPQHGANVKFLDDGRTMETSGNYIDLVSTTRNRIPLNISITGGYARGFSNSTKGYQFWSTANVSVGDQLWILYGTKSPVLLRPFGSVSRLISSARIDLDPMDCRGERGDWYYKWRTDCQTKFREPPVRVRLI